MRIVKKLFFGDYSNNHDYVTCKCGNMVAVKKPHDFSVLPCPSCVEKEKELKLGFNLNKKEMEKKVNNMLYHNSAYILGKIDGEKEGREGVIREIDDTIKNLKNYNWSDKEIELWWEGFKHGKKN